MFRKIVVFPKAKFFAAPAAWLIVSALWLAFLPTAARAESPKHLWTTGERVNVRAAPPDAQGNFGKLVGQLPFSGMRLDCLEGPKDGWYKIRRGSVTGWTIGRYLRTADEADDLEPDKIADLDLFLAKIRKLAEKKAADKLLLACADEITASFSGGEGKEAAKSLWLSDPSYFARMTAALDEGYAREEVETDNPKYEGAFAVSPPAFLIASDYDGFRFVFLRERRTKFWRITAFVEGD